MRKFVDFVNNNKFFCCFILAIIVLLVVFRMNMYERRFIKRNNLGVCLHVVNKITNKHYFEQTFYKGLEPDKREKSDDYWYDDSEIIEIK